MKNPIKVLLVEDDFSTQERLISTLQANPIIKVIGVAGTAAAAMEQLYLLEPDVALIDLGLPDQSGVSLLKWTSQHKPHIQTLVITAFADEDHVMRAINGGASGYLLKDASADELVAHIQEVLEGGSPISPMIARKVLALMNPTAGQCAQTPPTEGDNSAQVDLTQRELQVINQVARGFTLSEVAEQIGISRHTVATHVKHIYRKLQVTNQAEAVYEATLAGLIQPE